MTIVIRGKSKCPICDGLLDDQREYFGTPHFIVVSSHPLYRFSGSAMHRDCFITWPHASEFRKAFDEFRGERFRHECRMLENGDIVRGSGEENEP